MSSKRSEANAQAPMNKGQPSANNRARHWLRTLLPALLVLAWLVAAGIGGPYFGRVGEVSSNDQTSYLPDSADATKVQKLLGAFNGASELPAVIVFVGQSELSAEQRGVVEAALESLREVEGVGAVSPAIPSQDGMALQAFAALRSGDGVSDSVELLTAKLAAAVPPGIQAYVTGPAGFIADLVKGFAGIDGLLLVVALVAVFVILILVYRSFLLPVAVLLTSLSALTVALLTVWWLAKTGVLLLSGQTQGILFILVIGAATDYSLLYVSRYREALRVEQDRWAASRRALRGAFEPIVASGSTVIAGLMCLLLSDLRSNSTLGPVASVGIVFAMLAALTLLPSLLFAFGRNAFWPRRPKYEPEVVAAEHGLALHGGWRWLARLIETRPRQIWLLTTAVLALLALAATQLKADGVPQSDLVLGASQARAGQIALGKHFPGGSGSPVMVVVPEARLQPAADVLLGHAGITGVSVKTAASPSGTAPVSAAGVSAFGPPGTPAPAPTVVDGQVLLQGTLDSAADSDAAALTVRDLRRELTAVPGALVGGVTATAIDTNDASIHDRNLIIPVVLAVILVILMLLLRAVVAPVLLMLSTMLSFLSALGVAALVFNGVFHFPGADPAVPLYGFVFLVALGIDYNIFLMTRVREEALQHGTREGIVRGLAVTGGVITSAGLVLAATFAALGVIPILFLAQIAFIVAFGVLLDTFVVRSLLVPALTYDIGRAIWWPSKLAVASSAAAPASTAAKKELEGRAGRT